MSETEPGTHATPTEPMILEVGAKVRIASLPPYVKTADPMPMLRPPDVIRVGEIGEIVDRRPGGYWCVRFANGTFLLEAGYFTHPHATAPLAAEPDDTAP